uniref:Uncharacterized protein n=1 Tax=mine drainage metagenome TaxID=410659 RepID=E6QMT9_9ZZZZ
MYARGREVFAGAIGYSLSVGTTEGEAMDGACVVIANLALRWVGGGYADFRPYPYPCRTEQNSAWMGHAASRTMRRLGMCTVPYRVNFISR